jgi:hypothetical protein
MKKRPFSCLFLFCAWLMALVPNAPGLWANFGAQRPLCRDVLGAEADHH